MNYHKRLQLFAGIFIFLFLSFITTSLKGYEYDISCWRNWCLHIYKNGLDKAYIGSMSNYMPIFQYILWFFGKLAGSEEYIIQYINYLRSIILLFDMAGLWLIYKWARLKEDFILVLCFGLFNIAYLYNTIIWGQVDGIGATLIFGTLFAAYRKRVVLSSVLFVLSLNMKLQLGVFLPIWGLLVIIALADKGAWKKVLGTLAAMAVTQFLVALPFILGPGHGEPLLREAVSSFSAQEQLSACAYNLWYWFFKDPVYTTDTLVSPVGITYKQLGLILFCITSLIAMYPLMRFAFLKHFRRAQYADTVFPKERVWLIAALIAILFFFFNTEMHERYSHPAFIFITAYSFYRRRFLGYFLFSLAYFINLEDVLKWFSFPNYETVMFDPSFAAIVYALLLLYLYFLLYRNRPLAEQPAIQPAD